LNVAVAGQADPLVFTMGLNVDVGSASGFAYVTEQLFVFHN
jgi:hypothetical protein